MAVLASAAMAVAALPPGHVTILVPVMMVPLVWVLDGRSPASGFVAVWLYFSLVAATISRWLTEVLIHEYAVPAVPAWVFTIVLAASYSLLPAASAWVYCRLRHSLSTGVAPLVFGALWSLAEWVRSEPLGVPWVLAAHPLAQTPFWIQMADLVGVYGISFLVATVNAGIALSAKERRLGPFVPVVIILGLSTAYGAVRSSEPLNLDRTLRVAIVHSDVPPEERFQGTSMKTNSERLAARTARALAGVETDLVVWSETAIDGDLSAAPQLLERLLALASEMDTTLVAGAQRRSASGVFNSVFFLGPRFYDAKVYDKRRLVPFAEAEPPLVARLVAPLLPGVQDGVPYIRGSDPTVVERAGWKLAANVCFEITYTDLSRDARRAGADLMLNLSNDGWFGLGGYAELHLQHAVFRAVELRTWIVRNANGGVSAIIDSRGVVRASLAPEKAGEIVAEVGPAEAWSLYVRWGNAPVVVVMLATPVACVGLSARRRRATRHAST